MSVHSPSTPQLVTEHIGKSHVRVRKALATVDRSLGRIALTYGLQYFGLDVVAPIVLRLELAVESSLRREEQYLQSLVRDIEHDSNSSGRQPCAGGEADEQASDIERITTELGLLRQVTSNFTAPDDACRSYQSLMQQLEELASVLEGFIGETDHATFEA